MDFVHIGLPHSLVPPPSSQVASIGLVCVTYARATVSSSDLPSPTLVVSLLLVQEAYDSTEERELRLTNSHRTCTHCFPALFLTSVWLHPLSKRDVLGRYLC